MSERPPEPAAGVEPRVAEDRDAAPTTPRWVKALGVGAAVLIVVMFVLLHLSGAVGPGAH